MTQTAQACVDHRIISSLFHTDITPTTQGGGLTGREARLHVPRIPFTCRTITPMRRDVSRVFF